MSEIAPWIGIVTVGLAVIGHWLRVNVQVAQLDTRGAGEKAHCDNQLALIRAEVAAVEVRSNNGIIGVRAAIDRLDGKMDRLLERHP